MQLVHAARTDVGMIRSGNEDNFAADVNAGRGLFIVADGMGGHAGGDVASASTVLDLAPLDASGYASPATVLRRRSSTAAESGGRVANSGWASQPARKASTPSRSRSGGSYS